MDERHTLLPFRRGEFERFLSFHFGVAGFLATGAKTNAMREITGLGNFHYDPILLLELPELIFP